MDGYLSKKPKNFVDDPGKLYRQERRATQDKEIVDPKAETNHASYSKIYYKHTRRRIR
jgi:hypothetical protein